ncbi:MAG: diaminopimelate epimerase [Microscillaceae bacterium]|nr:diaminopimelate epimerase [Microscillaceae bacterium]MDW8459649.1 diaminopimelate epimerase [Cytophagales bacterium]
MQNIYFHKYQGTGNDFIVIDNRSQTIRLNEQQIAFLCHRRFGIGADGLILIQSKPHYDFEMVYFNANGQEGSMCGNGGRCAVKFAQSLGIFEKRTTFWAIDGEHEAFIQQDSIHLLMQNVTEIERNSIFYFLNTGSPHYVQWVTNLQQFDVLTHGKSIRYNERFGEKGTNVNFIEQVGENQLFVRTYERGVENETYSCGTGVTAAALIAHIERNMQSPIQVQTLGGELAVSFEKHGNSFTQIYLIGKAEKVFEGQIVL